MKQINEVILSSVEPLKEALWIKPMVDNKYDILLFGSTGWESVIKESPIVTELEITIKALDARIKSLEDQTTSTTGDTDVTVEG